MIIQYLRRSSGMEYFNPNPGQLAVCLVSGRIIFSYWGVILTCIIQLLITLNRWHCKSFISHDLEKCSVLLNHRLCIFSVANLLLVACDEREELPSRSFGYLYLNSNKLLYCNVYYSTSTVSL